MILHSFSANSLAIAGVCLIASRWQKLYHAQKIPCMAARCSTLFLKPQVSRVNRRVFFCKGELQAFYVAGANTLAVWGAEALVSRC